MLKKAKDKMLATALRRVIEGKLNRYGKVVSFAVDSAAGTMALGFHPAGEPGPIRISIDEYRIDEADEAEGGVLLKIVRASADREWVSNLLEDFVAGQEVPISGAAGKFADWLL